MKKDEFIKLGLDEETAKKCESASTEELKEFVSKSHFDDVNMKKETLERAVEERDSQLEALKNTTGDVESLKQTIEDLQADNKAKDDAHGAEMKQLKVDTAVELAITGAKGKNAKAIRALLNLGEAELGEDGSIKGLAEQMAALQKAEDSKFLFATESKTQLKGATPGESGKEGADGKADTAHMTYSEQVAYMTANPDATMN